MDSFRELDIRKRGPPTPGAVVTESHGRPSPVKAVSFQMNESPLKNPSPSIRSRSVPGDMGEMTRSRAVPGDLTISDRGIGIHRIPPSPGGAMFSSPNPSGKPKRPPSPGTFSAAPPDLAALSHSESDDPSPPQSTTLQRFVFTKDVTGVVPPSKLTVASVKNNPEEIHPKNELDGIKQFTDWKESEAKSQLVKQVSPKPKNPIGTAFLQKMNWSDSYDSEDEELEAYRHSKLNDSSAAYDQISNLEVHLNTEASFTISFDNNDAKHHESTSEISENIKSYDENSNQDDKLDLKIVADTTGEHRNDLPLATSDVTNKAKGPAKSDEVTSKQGNSITSTASKHINKTSFSAINEKDGNVSDTTSVGSSGSAFSKSRRDQLNRVKSRIVRGSSPSPVMNKISSQRSNSMIKKERLQKATSNVKRKSSPKPKSGRINPYTIDSNVLLYNTKRVLSMTTENGSSTKPLSRLPSLEPSSRDKDCAPTTVHSDAERLKVLREKAESLRKKNSNSYENDPDYFDHDDDFSIDNVAPETSPIVLKPIENIHYIDYNGGQMIQPSQSSFDQSHKIYTSASCGSGTKAAFVEKDLNNIYSGPFKDLLPWSSNLFIFRMYGPTFPSSLIYKDSTPSKAKNIDLQIEEIQCSSAQDENRSFASNSISIPKQDVGSYVSLSLDRNQNKSFESDDDENNEKDFPEKINEGESTIIGQYHVQSFSEPENEGIAEWWDKSYAHSQDEVVNHDVKEALSNSMNNSFVGSNNSGHSVKNNIADKDEVESDEDVFFGIDEYPSPIRRKSGVDNDEHDLKIQLPSYNPLIVHPSNLNDTRRKNCNQKNGKYYTSDAKSCSSQSASSSSDDSKTMGSANAESVELSPKEHRKWSEREEREYGISYSNSVYSLDESFESRDHIAERRSNAHEKLLLHAYTALSLSSPAVAIEKGMDRINPGIDHMQMLEGFCKRIKVEPLEVLKLNREKKWQTRFLTVSKEGTWLKRGEGLSQEYATFCPLGMLWVKKLIKGNIYSIASMDNSGKGGGLLAHLDRFDIQNDVLDQHPLARKQSMRFHDCMVVRLYFQNQNFVTFACTKSSFEAIVAGCNAIIEVLTKVPRVLPTQQLNDRLSHKLQSPSGENEKKISNHVARQKNQTKMMMKVGIKVANSPVVAKSLSGQGAPHLWEA